MEQRLSRKIIALIAVFALGFTLIGSPLTSLAVEPAYDSALPANTPKATTSDQPIVELTKTDDTGVTQNDETPSRNFAAKAEQKLIIIHTNDAHCNVSQTFNKQGEPTSIGYAGIAAAAKSAKAEYGEDSVMLVDAGDAIQGKPLGTLSQGAYLTDIMNEVGYDIAVPGNHEFDFGIPQLHALADRANFPYLSCNFDDLRTGNTVFSPYKIEERAGVKVAYVGITTPESLTKSSPIHFKDADGTYIYGFCQDATGQALFSRVQQTVDEARAAGAQYVIAVGHLGESGTASPWRSDTVIANTSGIDVLIDGHSHEQFEQMIANREGKNVPLAQTGTHLQTYGKIIIDPAQDSISCELIEPPAAQDVDTAAFIKNIEDDLSKTLDKVVARSEVKLVAVENDARKNWAVRMHETNLGDLSADAFRSALDSDIAFANGGGIRADVEAGDITYGDAISVMPFGNALCKVEATGQTIIDALEMGARAYPEPNGGFLQTSGLTYEIRSDRPTPILLDTVGNFIGIEGDRRVQNVRVNEQPIDLTQTYTVASITYLLKEGGDGLSMFQDSKVLIDEQGLDYEALISYIQNDLGGTIGANSDYANENGSGRILIKNGPDPDTTPTQAPISTDSIDQANASKLARTADTAESQTAIASAIALSALATAWGAHRLVRRKTVAADRDIL